VKDSAMEESTTEKKQFPCKQCGAQLDFAPGTASLKCAYCGFENPIPQSEEQIEELDFADYLARAAEEHDTHEAPRVKCEKCAAETTMPADVTAGTCPFCGANLILAGKSSKLIKPKSLLPFKIPHKQAFEDFRKWIKSLWFAPNDLKRYARSEGKLTGVYVPHWTYDSDTTSFYRGERGDDYSETETYTAYEDGRPISRSRQVRKTRWRPVSGTVWNQFDDVLVLASKSLPRKYANLLEPWDLKNLIAYADDYLSGFRAESYQVGLAEGFEIAKQVMDEGIRASIRRDIGGDHQRIHSVKTQHDNVTFKHLLLPVWMSAYEYRNKIYRILINARTGEIQGERPYSIGKIIFAVLCALAAIGLIAFLSSLSQ
jgi:DNA-directed RNA polymerase subunit RPC12/RpoP